MGKKTPKQSPKKQPPSAATDVAEAKPECTQAGKQPPAQPSKENMSKQRKTSKGSSKMSHSNVLGAEGKKETLDERLARQKSAREALLEQGSHDNIEVITAAVKKMSARGKRKQPKEGEEQGEEEEEEEEEEGPPIWDFEESMAKLISLLDATVFVAEHDKATETCSLLEGILLEEGTWTTTRELLDRVMSVNAEIAAKVPHETTPRCVIYRMRKFIIDEFMTVVKDHIPESSTGVSAQTFFRDVISVTEIVPLDNYDIPDVPAGVDPEVVGAKVKQGLIAAIEGYKTELENIPNLIAAQGSKIIVEGDVIMTHSYCPSTAKLFLNAAEHCNFILYVLESAPLCYGHLLSEHLEESNIEVIIAADASSGALIPNISKVIMPCRALLHTGDCKTQAFGSTVAMAAAYYTKPVYCVAATYQFTPSMVPDVNQQLDLSFLGETARGAVPLIAHKFDLTDGKEVTKIVSNNAMLTPCQTQTHMAELYTPRLEKDELFAFNKTVV